MPVLNPETVYPSAGRRRGLQGPYRTEDTQIKIEIKNER
jgi:hypothetical protein